MEPVGESESAELAERATASRNMSKQGEDSHENDNADGPWATWQEESCNATEQHRASDNFWIAFFLFAHILSWMVLGAIAFWFWRKLDRRLYYNELQQARERNRKASVISKGTCAG